jgi:2-polyprenyl-3-methyl-5-hydroxy-6-metoxy-1,4-benzoquinol methylase
MEFSKTKLEEVAQNSLYTSFTNTMTIEYSYEIFRRFLKKGKILELGPAEGLMTKNLIIEDENLFVIEGSDIFAQNLKTIYPNLNIINALFEDAEINEKFDNIVLGHVLEHVESPQVVLSKVKSWLKPGGIVICAVPNARSLHRQAAVEMGLMKSIFDLSQKDIHHGHMRIYTPETLRTEFINAEFEVLHFGGYWMKPISDSQIEQNWSKEMLFSFMKIGETYPDIAGEIYIIAK